MNHSILESNEFDSQSMQKCSTFRLVLCSQFPEVRRAIQFDGDVAFNAEKVDNVATNAILPPKLLPEYLPALQVLP